jgi:outer membrane protein TolC
LVETKVSQRVWWGTEYQITWNGANRATNNVLSRFNPELASGLALSITQSLTRAFGIDQDRANFRQAQIGRGRADAIVERAVVSMTRAARRAYWEWVYALDVADVQRQSLQLARDLLQGNRRRADAGALAPTDVIEAEAEVARREESVLMSTSAAVDAEQALRRILVNPRRPSELRFTRGVVTEPTLPDLDATLEGATGARLELQLLRRDLESEDVNIRLATVDARPDVRVQADYETQSLAGTELLRTGTFPGTVTGTTQRPFASALRDVWTNAYPTWSAQVQVSYPLGTAHAEAAKAASRLRRRQVELDLADAGLAARTEIETVFRGAMTNRQRVDATGTSLALAERRLDAEERKFNAGLSTSFFVFQAQRDLSNAREAALRAALDVRRSAADADAVQVIPLNASTNESRR